jgi:hypothetical protein
MIQQMIEGPYTIPADQQEIVHRRLCEARVWCLSRLRANDPRRSLRSWELKPDRSFTVEHVQANGQTRYEFLKTAERVALVDEVCNRRSGLLANLDISCPDWSLAGDGELLIVEIDYSLWEGLPEWQSDGFFDTFDIPAWDTWVYLQRVRDTDVLLSWIPHALIPLVNKGIPVSTTDCIRWLDALILSPPTPQMRRWF